MSLPEPLTSTRYVIANSEHQAQERLWHIAYSEGDVEKVLKVFRKKKTPLAEVYEVVVSARRITK